MKSRWIPSETVLPVLLTPHDVSIEIGYTKTTFEPSPWRDDLPWLWVGGVPRLVPGVVTAYYGPKGEGSDAEAAARRTEVWLVALATLPAWGMKVDESVFLGLVGRGPRRAAYAPPTMSPSGANSGMDPRPSEEQARTRAIAAGLAAGAGPQVRSETYPPLVLSGPLKAFLDDLRAKRKDLEELLTPEQARAYIHVEDRLARALGEASILDKRLTADEVAEIERITPSGVRKRAAAGRYPGATRHHGVWLIPAESVSRP